MAEGFSPISHTTALSVSQVQGKSVWLFRVPRHVASSSLEGAVVKLKSRKDREGKVVGRLNDGSSKVVGAGLVLKRADTTESASFRALWTDDAGQLVATGSFAGQVNVSLTPPPLPEHVGESNKAAVVVEAYQGRPQLKGMRVRSKLAGAGTEYVRNRPRDPKVASSQQGGPESGDEPGSRLGTESEEDHREDKSHMDSGNTKTSDAHSPVGVETKSPGASARSKALKKKRLSGEMSSPPEAGAVKAARKVPSTAAKVKKSKKKDRRSL